MKRVIDDIPVVVWRTTSLRCKMAVLKAALYEPSEVVSEVERKEVIAGAQAMLDDLKADITQLADEIDKAR